MTSYTQQMKQYSIYTLALPVRMRKEPSAFSNTREVFACSTPKSILRGSLFFPDATASGSAAVIGYVRLAINV